MLQIITTHDGSHSLLNPQLNETYHSVHGAVQESMHVFIKNGLDYVSANPEKKSVRILEVGFGTGLNALLTHHYARERNVSIEYTTLEAFPIEESIWRQLNYAQLPHELTVFFEMHQSEWNEWTEISPSFTLRKLHTSLQLVSLDRDHYDLIFFDAFAPNKQPEMWELPMLEKIATAMKSKAIFVTYCAKGQLKRDLLSSGLIIETLQGPPGKREMIRAIKS